jgi:uncharacterized protein YfiM (DUF2279 family)
VSTAASNRPESRNIAPGVAHHRARVAGLARGVRSSNDPELIEARQRLYRAQQMAAVSAAIDATEARYEGDADRMTETLRTAGVPTGLVLLEAIELLALLVSLSDQPTEMLAALRQRVNAESTN